MSIGVGIVGYGARYSMGKHHANHVAQTEDMELRAIYDLDPTRREAAREEQPEATVHDTLEGLLADEAVDLVVLVTPHDTHAPISIAASEAGKHVMTEKPVALTVAEADQMIAAAERAGKVLTVYHNRRWDGDFTTVKRVLASGRLGRVFQIESCVNGHFDPGGWRCVRAHGGGMLYDWGAHLTDQIVQLMLPSVPQTVFATFHHGGHPFDIETQTTVVVAFDTGVSAQIDVGCVSRISRPRWLIRGEEGAFEMPDWTTARIVTAEGEGTVQVDESEWQAVYDNLSRHLNNGEALAVKPHEVRVALGIIEAAFESGRTRRAVSLGNEKTAVSR